MEAKREHLVFSDTQFEQIMSDETGLLKRMSYEGKEFTSRVLFSDKSPFEDAVIVFTGVILPSRIVYSDDKRPPVDEFPKKIDTFSTHDVYYDGNHFYTQGK